jgi:glyoxylase-like metal-dependent hydrolase (beta-lactamase superfamily II)
MKRLAAGVWRLKEFPAPTINCYLVEDVLVDAGRSWDRRRIFSEIEGRELSLLALTHVHPDHQGMAKDVCEARGIPLACHADDVDAMEGRRPVHATSHPRPPLAGPAARSRPCAERGGRRPRSPRTGARAGRGDLLPRLRQGRDLRRRDSQHELSDVDARDQGAAPTRSHRTLSRIGTRSASWPSSSRL